MVSDGLVATVVLLSVSLSLPCFLYGAYYIIETEPVTWDVLVHHLKFVTTGLVLTTVPMVFWMIPRLPDQLGGLSAVHAMLGLQATRCLPSAEPESFASSAQSGNTTSTTSTTKTCYWTKSGTRRSATGARGSVSACSDTSSSGCWRIWSVSLGTPSATWRERRR